MARYKNIAYVVTREGSDTGHIPHYFTMHAENFYLCEMPPFYQSHPAIFKHYRRGALVRSASAWPYKGNNKILMLCFYYLSFLLFLATFKITNTTIIVSSPLFAFMNSLSRLLMRNRTVFWIFDYFPNPKSTTRINNAMTWFYNTRMQAVLYLSPGIEQVYRMRNIPEHYIRKIVGFGIIRKTAERHPRKNTVGYIGNLCAGKGLYLLLEAAALQKDLVVEIIGNGPLRDSLEQYTQKLNIQDRVSFFGFVPNEKLSIITNHWIAGTALYEYGDLNYTDYTDPGKVKLYIDLGIPAIMTAISSMHSEVSRMQAGIVVPCDAQHLIQALRTIQDNQSLFAKGVEKLAEEHLLEPRYEAAFKFLEQRII